VRTPQYPSFEKRNHDIEAGAGRPIAEHVADLTAAAARFLDAATKLPAQAWTVTVQGTNSAPVPAAWVVWARLREVEVHHVDLAAGYEPASWPEAFTHRLLHELATGFADDPAAPGIRLHASDLGHDVTIGSAADPPTISGPGYAIAAWLTGRSSGSGLTVKPAGSLPSIPTWK
jgi:maleylpyruvate isomerase